MPEGLTVVSHPVLDDRVAELRDETTSFGDFRRALGEASAILAIEATRGLPTVDRTVQTPLEEAPARRLEAEIILVPVLRAGLAMVEGFLRLLPDARVGHLGMQRDEATLEPSGYFERLPPTVGEGLVFLLDPMLATGGTLASAIRYLVDLGADDITAITLLSAPEGIQRLEKTCADLDVPVRIVTGAIDEKLNERGYIVPGLGDAGDRLYGIV